MNLPHGRRRAATVGISLLAVTAVFIGGTAIANASTALGRLTAPANVKTSVLTANTVTLTWNAVSGATSYVVQLRQGTNSGALVTTLKPKSATATFNNLKATTKYTALIWPSDAAIPGGPGTNQPHAEFSFSTNTTPGRLTAPTNVRTSVLTENTVTLNWNAVDGATSYVVQLRQGTNSGLLVNTAKPGPPAATFNGLKSGTKYTALIWPGDAAIPGGPGSNQPHAEFSFTTAGYACGGTVTDDKSACYFWVQAFQSNGGNFTASGVSVTMSQPDPIIGPDVPGGLLNHSVAEIYAESADGKQAIELGWYKDNTRKVPIVFATHWINNQFMDYAENGNTGFVQTNSSFPIGSPVVGTQGSYKILHSGTQWQVFYNGTEIGYFPDSLWTTAGTSFTTIGQVIVYGEVETNPNAVSMTQMGNGVSGSSAGAATFSNYALVNSSVPAQLTDFGQPPDSSLYAFGQTSDTGFSYGGSGAR